MNDGGGFFAVDFGSLGEVVVVVGWWTEDAGGFFAVDFGSLGEVVVVEEKDVDFGSSGEVEVVEEKEVVGDSVEEGEKELLNCVGEEASNE